MSSHTPGPALSSPPLTSGTTWLTRLRLNSAHRAVQHDLRDAAALHRRIMSLLPDRLGDNPRARAGVLFRLDTDDTLAPTLLVQSGVAPDTERLPNGYGSAQTRDMSVLLTALRPGLPVRYRFLGNAVRRCGRNSTQGHWKQAIPLLGGEAEEWWARRADDAGLVLHTVLSDAADTLPAWHRARDQEDRSRKNGVRVDHRGRRFEGTATVRDADALRSALLNGIGRSKSYGCGLLSLAPGRQTG
ncbi:type I-E CRISPR-associated protein Cas6/Cse3/CasE [Streptomyces sp. NPDC003717]|uniref:type I-E CRISPR-associated protein Cas6/Cse3/CasE n=1 Tax=Streptomyces sp. NPDC003717 TaxID=3154276 RepID=UPI0033B57D94